MLPHSHYCFVCGARAHHDSDRWRKGGCPRWNQPGTERAHHDDRVEELAIEAQYTDRARILRQEADAAPEHVPMYKQMNREQAECQELIGEIVARGATAEEQRREVGARVF